MSSDEFKKARGASTENMMQIETGGSGALGAGRALWSILRSLLYSSNTRKHYKIDIIRFVH